MPKYRSALPQMTGEPFLTDAGLETDLMFNHGVEIREFAAHTLLESEEGRRALSGYFEGLPAISGLSRLAQERQVGFILDSQTWKAHMHWADDLSASQDDLRGANQAAIDFIAQLRADFRDSRKPIVLNAIVGPRGDAYAPEAEVAADEAERYHLEQLGWLAATDADMVTALTFTQATEAVGFVRAARRVGLPVVVSFTVETDGNLPTGQSLEDAIVAVDSATGAAAEYFMVNCAHPDHFSHVLDDAPWARRIHGIRCNASRQSHAELDESETLDDGDPEELAQQYSKIVASMPWVNVVGGCCGADVRHMRAIADALSFENKT